LIEEDIKILVVEDNQADVILIKRQVEKIVQNPLIYQVSEFDEFLVIFKEFKPDILLCDYRLGSFTGLDVLSHVKLHKPDLPFIFMTSSIDNQEIAENTVLNSVTDFILKKNINTSHVLLLPHFEAIAKKKRNRKLPPGHQKKIDQMRQYMKDIETENEAHKEDVKYIKKDLERFRAQNNKK